jgi:hypothetical protein
LNGLDVSVAQASFSLAMRQLVRGEIEVARASIVGANVVLPADIPGWIEQLRKPESTTEAPEPTRSPSSGRPLPIRLSVPRISFKDIFVYVAGDETPKLKFDVELQDILTTSPSCALNAELPALGETAALMLNLRFARSDTPGVPLSVSGEADLRQAMLNEFIGVPGFPVTSVGLHVALSGTVPSALTADVSGAITPDEFSSLASTVTAHAAWDGATLAVSDISCKSRDLSLAGGLTRTPDGALHLALSECVLARDLFALGAGMAPVGVVMIAPRQEAVLSLRDAALERTAQGVMRLHKGALEFSGLDVQSLSGSTVIEGLGARLTLDEDVLRVEACESKELKLSGSVQHIPEESAFRFDMAGDATLSTPLLDLLPSRLPAIEKIQGALDVKKLGGVVRLKPFALEDLNVQASLKNTQIDVKSRPFTDKVKGVSGSLVIVPASIALELKGQTAQTGAVKLVADYVKGDKRLSGTLDADVSKIGRTVLGAVKTATPAQPGAPTLAERLGPVLDAFGPTTLALSAEGPDESGGLSVRLTREGVPSVNFSADMGVRAGNLLPVSAAVSIAGFPLDSLQGLLPKSVKASGPLILSAQWTEDGPSLKAEANLDATDLAFEPMLRKAGGVPAAARFSGVFRDNKLVPVAAAANINGQDIPVVFGENGNISARSLDIDLAKLSPLLPPCLGIRGQVTGDATLNPPRINAHLINFGATAEPGGAIDALNSDIEFDGEKFHFRNTHLVAANSDITANISGFGDTWSGDASGPFEDVNSIIDAKDIFEDCIKGWIRSKRIPGEPISDAVRTGINPALKEHTFKMVLDAKFGAVYFKRARFEEVSAIVTVSHNLTSVRNLRCRPYHGLASGAMDFYYNQEAEENDWFHMALVLEEVDVRALEEIISDTPKQVSGLLTGDCVFNLPLSGPPLPWACGDGRFEAKNGSLGNWGWASNILTALKTTDLFRLRLPNWGETGITFDHCYGDLNMDHGVLNLNDVKLKSLSFSLEGKGAVDFVTEKTDVAIRANLIKSFTDIFTTVPVIGQSIDKAVTDYTELNLVMIGNPANPNIKLASKPIGGQPGVEGTGLMSGIRSVTRSARDLVLPRGKAPKPEGEAPADPMTSQPAEKN